MGQTGHVSSQVSVSPRQGLNARQAETVERLLAAGLEELRAVGHEALTVRTVADRAGRLAGDGVHLPGLEEPPLRRAVLALPGRGRPRADRVDPDRAAAVGDPPPRRAAGRVARARGRGHAGAARHRPGRRAAAAADRRRVRRPLPGRARRATPTPPSLEALALAFSGALLQGGMGLMTYTEMGDRLDAVVAVIMKGNDDERPGRRGRSSSTPTTTRSRRTPTRSTGAAATRTRCTTTRSTTSGC